MFSSVDTIWVLLATVLVFFMQAGFAMVETGFTRAKNAGNIIMKNVMDFALGSVFFWVIGFSLIFGASNGGFIGTPDLFLKGDYSSTIPTAVFFMFQTVFCGTAATIVSGGMAERTKYIAYCVYSILISAFIYPVSCHWIWGGGWLGSLGFHDFAGSTAVHMVGGIAALTGAKALGPRIGKYAKDGSPKAIPGHNLTLGALGVFILWFAWFGFNGGSTVSISGDESIVAAGSIFLTTNLSAASAGIAGMIITWLRYKKPDVSMTLNCVLGGLVAITAGCDAVSPTGAVIIGLLAGIVLVFGLEFVDKKMKIDDPVGAFGVHGICGAFGTILTGLFALDGGLFYGGGVRFLGVQVLGVIAVALWITITMSILYAVLKRTVGLRVSREEEISGLDWVEHGLKSSYADFAPLLTEQSQLPEIPAALNIPLINKGEDNKFTKLSIITSRNNLGTLKNALQEIGISGITVSEVLGAGMQRGYSEYYRGVKLDINLLPKVRVEVVLCKIPVESAVEVIKKALYTGKYGDGKIFIYDVENVIKIRTGEQGFDALQDEE
jgi:Amt family ammonium transporter